MNNKSQHELFVGLFLGGDLCSPRVNVQDVGMAVSWTYGLKIDFVRNPITRSAACF